MSNRQIDSSKNKSFTTEPNTRPKVEPSLSISVLTQKPKPEPQPNTDSKTADVRGMEKVHEGDVISLTMEQNSVVTIDEKRRVCSFRGDPKLWSEFVKFCDEEYGSVCHVLEAMIKAVISAHAEYTKHERPVFEIKELRIERVVQRSRRIYREPEVSGEPRSWSEKGSPGECAVCGAEAFGRGNFGSELLWLCKEHFLKEKRRMIGFRYLEGSG